MIAIILGTRPEIIKMSPVIRECERKGVDYFILHTGQHYSYAMDKIFFDELDLPHPKFNVDAGSGSHAEQTGKIMVGIENVLQKEKPERILVQGDTNTVLAGALTASKMGIPVGHVEAGLRSFDRRMPEEVNRIVTDHLSEYLFTPTEVSRQNLIHEGIDEMNIFVTGNTVVDAVFQNREIARKKTSVLHDRGITDGNYFLVTAHRAENVDDPIRLQELIRGLTAIGSHYNLPVVFPMHPRTRKKMVEFGIDARGITMIDPVGYLEFLELEAHARLILTDSGGVQEEACILRVPCVTLRENTERPETIDAGANMLAGTDAPRITQAAERMLQVPRTWKNPYGNGDASERIVRICNEIKVA